MAKNYFLSNVLILLAAATFLSACSKLNPPEVIPAYGNVDKIALTTNYFTQGSDSTNGITDAWIYSDENPVGAFQMPCTFPIVASTGTHNILVFAGIEDDGSSGQRTKYPFFTDYSINANLTQGSTTVFKPTVTYQTWTDFAWMVDFESSSYSLHKDTITRCDTSVVIVNKKNDPADVFEGNYSGGIYLTAAHQKIYFRGLSDTLLFKNDGNPIYLEMNYKTNTPFIVGILGTINNPGMAYRIVYVDTASHWKKMYVNISQMVQTTGTDVYNVYFEMSLDTNVQRSASLFLDDLKVLRHK